MRQIGVKNVKLSEYEMSIAAHLVDPLSMQVLFILSQSGGRMEEEGVEGSRLLPPAPSGLLPSAVALSHSFTRAATSLGQTFMYVLWCVCVRACVQITWSDIAGLDEVITELKETVILPVQKRHLFQNSRLLQPPKGKVTPRRHQLVQRLSSETATLVLPVRLFAEETGVSG